MTAAGLSIYASSKAAVCGYMRTCAIELGGKGIRSNAVLPGMVETKLINSGTYTDEDKQEDLNSIHSDVMATNGYSPWYYLSAK